MISSAGGIAAVLYGILPGQFVFGGGRGFGGVVLLTSRGVADAWSTVSGLSRETVNG